MKRIFITTALLFTGIASYGQTNAPKMATTAKGNGPHQSSTTALTPVMGNSNKGVDNSQQQPPPATTPVPNKMAATANTKRPKTKTKSKPRGVDAPSF